LFETTVAIVLFLAIAYVIWVVASARGDRPWKLRRQLRAVARCTMTETVSARDLASRLGDAVGRIDGAIITSRATLRKAAWCLVLDEGDRVTPFVILVQKPESDRHIIDVELRSGQVLPPAPRVAPSKRVLGALEKALLAMPAIDNVRWTRDRRRWHERPFDGA
jgi:hypothetical protein